MINPNPITISKSKAEPGNSRSPLTTNRHKRICMHVFINWERGKEGDKQLPSNKAKAILITLPLPTSPSYQFRHLYAKQSIPTSWNMNTINIYMNVLTSCTFDSQKPLLIWAPIILHYSSNSCFCSEKYKNPHKFLPLILFVSLLGRNLSGRAANE